MFWGHCLVNVKVDAVVVQSERGGFVSGHAFRHATLTAETPASAAARQAPAA